MVSGTLIGIFFVGTLIPWVNSKGALVGGIASAVFVGWISFGTQIEIAGKKITFPMKPFSVEGCDNATLQSYYASAANHSAINEVQ